MFLTTTQSFGDDAAFVYEVQNDSYYFQQVIRQLQEICGTFENGNCEPTSEQAFEKLTQTAQSDLLVLEDTWSRFLTELPPSLKGYLSKKCFTKKGLIAIKSCLDEFIQVPDEEIIELAQDPKINPEATKTAYRHWALALEAHGIYSYQCEKQAEKLGHDSEVCFPPAKYKNVDQIDYQPTPHFPTVACPDFIEQEACYDSIYDPTKYTRKIEVTGTRHYRDSSYNHYGAVFHYEPTVDIPLGQATARDYLSGIYDVIRPSLDKDISFFLAELYLEQYLQFASLLNQPPSLGSVLASCDPEMSNIYSRLSSALPETSQSAQDLYRKNTVFGAQCMEVIINRLEELRSVICLEKCP